MRSLEGVGDLTVFVVTADLGVVQRFSDVEHRLCAADGVAEQTHDWIARRLRLLGARLRRRSDVEEQRLVPQSRVGRHAALEDLVAGVAVHQRVVDLHVDRESSVLEAFDEVQFPRWPGEVDILAVQPGDQDAQLAFVAGAGECRPPNVVVDVELVVDDPRLIGPTQHPRMGQLEVPRRNHFKAAGVLEHLAQITGGCIGRRRERHQRCDVHHRAGGFAVQEEHVLRA